MKKALLLVLAAIGLACGINEKRLAFKGDAGEVIYYRPSGDCKEASVLDNSWMREAHYSRGEVYGIRLFTGELVPPSAKPKRPDAYKLVWMCRFHIAEWVGVDPKTGKRAAWLMKQ